MSRPELPHRVIAAVEIQHIRLMESKCKTSVRVPEGNMHIDHNVTSRVKDHRPDGTFVVETAIESRVTKDEAPRKAIIAIAATFELTYKLPKKLSVSSGELKVFANTNAVFNAWPYFREFIQSMFVRMTLPPPILRVYRMPSGPKPSRPKNGNSRQDQSQK